ncbi:hypothetical protein NDU88_002328 [Pleurodeles waltl]|uniref:Uncharacterized protein n=1 Tax=Pleurodeles waltl TaxID=8319 RepID=A0AAV7SBA8_PLEWA|nr:hypothetical protein NDU88_002328 [Pleurodeles waltl]
MWKATDRGCEESKMSAAIFHLEKEGVGLVARPLTPACTHTALAQEQLSAARNSRVTCLKGGEESKGDAEEKDGKMSNLKDPRTKDYRQERVEDQVWKAAQRDREDGAAYIPVFTV